jgi:hypothetical protein
MLTHCIIDNINNYTFNFKKLLNKKDIIIWKNCEDLKINVDSRINKFIFENCKNLKITLSDAIIGVEFNNCKNIKLKIKKDKKVNSFETFKSDISLKISNKDYKKITFFKENSKLFLDSNI